MTSMVYVTYTLYMYAADVLTAAVPCPSALHDVSEDLLHQLTVGQVAAVVLTLSLPLQALVCVKQ